MWTLWFALAFAALALIQIVAARRLSRRTGISYMEASLSWSRWTREPLGGVTAGTLWAAVAGLLLLGFLGLAALEL